MAGILAVVSVESYLLITVSTFYYLCSVSFFFILMIYSSLFRLFYHYIPFLMSHPSNMRISTFCVIFYALKLVWFM